jgi:cysteine desulfuration protein SufE
VISRDNLSQIDLDTLMAASNWQQQYKLIIQWGKRIKPKPEMRLPENLVKGCEIPVWITYSREEGLHWFAVDSDSSVMNGLVVLLLVQVNGKADAELRSLDLTARLHDLGLQKHLTPSRNNGFNTIIARIYQHLGIG